MHFSAAAGEQLHASLDGTPVLEAEELLERVADVEEQVVATKKAERFSGQFYTLNWLKRNPGWVAHVPCHTTSSSSIASTSAAVGVNGPSDPSSPSPAHAHKPMHLSST